MSQTPSAANPTAASALRRLLEHLAEQVPVETLDELWIFPPRTVGRTESRVVVASTFHEDDDRRRVFTALYHARTTEKGKTTVEEAIAEHGIAPADRVGRVVEGVLQRLDDELAAAPPRTERIGGDPERWAALLDDCAPPVPADPSPDA